jgi:hypothetical protein
MKLLFDQNLTRCLDDQLTDLYTGSAYVSEANLKHVQGKKSGKLLLKMTIL